MQNEKGRNGLKMITNGYCRIITILLPYIDEGNFYILLLFIIFFLLASSSSLPLVLLFHSYHVSFFLIIFF